MGRLPFIVAVLCLLSCPASARAEQYGVSFLDSSTPSTLETAERYSVPLTLRNTGTLPWKRAQLFRLAYHWADGQGRVVVRDGVRTDLAHDVEPGSTIQLCATVVAPDAAGAYQLQWDMVHEQHTWFSGQAVGNMLTAPVTVVAAAATGVGAHELLITALFWLITLAPLPLTAFWILCWWGSDITSWDEYLFHVVVFGAGHVYLVLQTLVFTIGMSLTTVGLSLVVVHGVVAAATWRARHSHTATAGRPSATPLTTGLSPFEIFGATVLLGLMIQWAWAASGGIEILGTDAANYHVPHAVNFLRGVSPLNVLATPHLYPMGTSVWAAWFFVPFDGPLLLELATAPAFLLLVGASCLLVRLLTNRSGLAWTPWLLLLAFTGQLPRLSLLMSADLAYAASFVALAVQVLLVWRLRKLDVRQVLALALCAGWLASTKAAGLFSLACIAVCGAAALFLVHRKQGSLSGLRLLPVAVSLAVFVGSGGMWILRNWWLFGSPLAPYGMSVFGIQLFAGPPTSSTRFYLSVLGDLRDRPDYALWGRFAESVHEMFGAWVVPAAGLAVLLPVDLALQFVRRRAVSQETQTKLIFISLLLVTFAVHAAVIAGLPWTSLDWTRNLSIRYLLPFFFLYMLALYSLLFTDGITWDRWPVGRTLGAAILAGGALWYYHAHEATPGLPVNEWIAVLRPEAFLAAAALTIPTSLALSGRFRFVSVTTATVAAVVLLVGLSWHEAADYGHIAASRARQARQESSCGTAGAAPSSEHRGLYLGVVEFQRSGGHSCERTRFFVASRFDRPIELQSADYRNVLLDVRSSAAALERQGPEPGGCDIIVAAKADLEGRGPEWLGEVLKTRRSFEQVAESGRYVAYAVK